MNKLQHIQLEIMEEIYRLCILHDIKYFLSAGTLLGAVRHQGFIPWDDDLDIGMTRDNYKKFLEVIQKDLSDKFYYLSNTNNQYYPLRYIKVMKTNTRVIEEAQSKEIENYGIFVDVFVFDQIPNNKFLQIKHNVTAEIYQKLLYAKVNSQIETSKLKKVIFNALRIMTKPVSKKFLAKRLDKVMQKYQGDYYTNVGEYFANYNLEKISSQDINDLTLYKFEDKQFYSLKNADKYLSNLYGDYLTLPPKNERFGHHNLTVLKY